MPTVVSVFGVEPFRIGGAESFARELSLQLGQHGWKSILCFQSEPPDDVRRFLELPNVSLEVVQDSTDLSWNATRSVARMLRQYQPEILHLHFTGFLGIYPWLAKLLSATKVFFTDHTSRPSGYMPRRAPVWKRTLVRIINQPITKVICVSKYGYECMTSLGLLPTERFELVYNGVDLSRVTADQERAAGFRRKYSIPEDRTVVAQVSWMIPEKGIPHLLQAARLVLSQNRAVQFLLVGEGIYREQYMRDAEAMGLDDHVTWTGLVQDPLGEGLYEVADILCQVSYWEELFGWMIAEAMAYGKPIIGTRVGGIPELITDQESGFLVDRGDINAMAARLLTLIENPELRRRMGHAGTQAVVAKFDLRPNVARLIDSYGIKSSNTGSSPSSQQD